MFLDRNKKEPDIYQREWEQTYFWNASGEGLK